jgi:hypothetical protein
MGDDVTMIFNFFLLFCEITPICGGGQFERRAKLGSFRRFVVGFMGAGDGAGCAGGQNWVRFVVLWCAQVQAARPDRVDQRSVKGLEDTTAGRRGAISGDAAIFEPCDVIIPGGRSKFRAGSSPGSLQLLQSKRLTLFEQIRSSCDRRLRRATHGGQRWPDCADCQSARRMPSCPTSEPPDWGINSMGSDAP